MTDHYMRLIGNSPRGEQWLCPSCGRHFILCWPPEYSKTVLVEGNPHVTHYGSKGGLHLDVSEILVGKAATDRNELMEAVNDADLG